ncbi:hypothetical protein MKP08_08115 [Erythrobacter sp. LQ02-29]|uniref:hypothetical protein n=1 Tax=Erythrobacter sp. LQ02-29 TaxID=2920384 RepID=UPI001F4E0050|nr:hypothetical protein [Erythrobacter sp. LQ02-29]MCP9222707.1 hypothetical protein [Erythrobacter sp. LQ02-29]
MSRKPDPAAPDAERWLRRLACSGIATFLLISAFDIHRWRVERWQEFDAAFAFLKGHVFGIPPEPVWLYALAFPIVAVNFGCHVQILRGRRRGILKPFVGSALAIAIMPLFGWQGVIYRMIWPDILSFVGYGIGGAIAAILAFGLVETSQSGQD